MIHKSTIRNLALALSPVALLVAVFSILLNSPLATAANMSNFDASYIMSDTVMANKDAMSEAQIQSFLKSKNPCNDTNLSRLSGYNATSGWLNSTINGQPFTYYYNLKDGRFVCMADDTFNGESAARIIWQAAQDYTINPQVLIVLLEKEQGLVRDTWPNNNVQYRSATGYGCPDTAACDTQYYGFKNQVRNAARFFRAHLNNDPCWTKPHIPGVKRQYVRPENSCNGWEAANSGVRFHPNAACGATDVNIKNRATSGLYSYTPYQPNQAALSAGYGTGDGCSSYGNRNFWGMFTDWFGSTTGAPVSSLLLPDGVYEFTSPVAKKSLDVANGSTANGAAVQLYSTNHTNAQRWQITYDGEGYYSVQNVASGKYLDISEGSLSSGAKVQIYQGNGSCAQKWSIQSSGKSVYLVGKCAGYAIDISGGNLVNSATIQTYPVNYSNSQLWLPVSTESASINDGFYKINSLTGLSIDVANSATVNGSKVQINTAAELESQYWQVNRLSSGLYTIRNPISNKYLDVPNASTMIGSAMQIFSDTSSCAQKWAFVKTGSYYNLRSACSSLVLDVANAAMSVPGTAVQTYTSNDTTAQQWQLTSLSSEIIPSGTYSIKSKSGLALDITGGSSANSTPLQIYTSNRSAVQQWKFAKQPDGTFSIYNPHNGRYLDVRGANIVNGSVLQIYTNNSTCAQKWNLVINSDKTYSFLSACSNTYAIDITGGAIGSLGTKVQIYKSNGSGSQSWVIDTP
jgi:hypothetical protein